jgi:hypothetical protein
VSAHPLIALWSHPRSMSTATERLMRERGDCTCFHEPFLYDYYVAREVRRFPHFEPEAGKPRDYAAIRAMLMAAAERQPVFFKDMSYYVVPRLFSDRAFAERVTHLFLIRDPRRSIASFHKLDPDLTCEEIGLEAQWRHAAFLRDELGRTPLILEAEAIQRDTAAAAEVLFRAAGLPPAPHALDWQEDEVPVGWEEVESWHQDVLASKGIRPVEALPDADEVFEAEARKAPRLRDYLAHHWPFYDRLKELAG